MGETYKNGDTLDGTQEGPLIHGAEGGASGTARVLSISSAGAGAVEITNETIQQTTTVAHDDLNLVVGGKDTAGNVQPVMMNTSGAVYTVQYAALIPEKYDQLSIAYTGSQITSVIYLHSGTTQATLTLAYDGDNLTSVVKT